MATQSFKDDTFVKFFDVADRMRQVVLQTSTNKKTQALIESLTYRQHKAIVAVTLLTENNPIGITLKKLAELRDIPEEDMAEITWNNACLLYGISLEQERSAL